MLRNAHGAARGLAALRMLCAHDEHPPTFEGYAYGGTRALVQLHDRHLRSFVGAWRRAVAADVALPPTEDPTCRSLAAMLDHVLRAARGYMTWICEKLQLPDPGIREVPEDPVPALDEYVGHLLDRWDGPLRALDQQTVEGCEFPSRWGSTYCIDAMLEHAVMHPLRHELQLERAQAAAPSSPGRRPSPRNRGQSPRRSPGGGPTASLACAGHTPACVGGPLRRGARSASRWEARTGGRAPRTHRVSASFAYGEVSLLVHQDVASGAADVVLDIRR